MEEEASPCCVAARAAADAVAAAPPSSPAEDSVYLVDDAWQDQRGATKRLAEFAGHPVVVAMIFTHCSYACPRIVADMKAIAKAADAAGRDDVRYVLVSMDDVRDTPERLAAFAVERDITGPRWTLLHGAEASVQVLSAVLGVRFKRAPSGDFAHSNLVAVLDDQGRIVHRQEGLDLAPDDAAASITKLKR